MVDSLDSVRPALQSALDDCRPPAPTSAAISTDTVANLPGVSPTSFDHGILSATSFDFCHPPPSSSAATITTPMSSASLLTPSPSAVIAAAAADGEGVSPFLHPSIVARIQQQRQEKQQQLITFKPLKKRHLSKFLSDADCSDRTTSINNANSNNKKESPSISDDLHTNATSATADGGAGGSGAITTSHNMLPQSSLTTTGTVPLTAVAASLLTTTSQEDGAAFCVAASDREISSVPDDNHGAIHNNCKITLNSAHGPLVPSESDMHCAAAGELPALMAELNSDHPGVWMPTHGVPGQKPDEILPAKEGFVEYHDRVPCNDIDAPQENRNANGGESQDGAGRGNRVPNADALSPLRLHLVPKHAQSPMTTPTAGGTPRSAEVKVKLKLRAAAQIGDDGCHIYDSGRRVNNTRNTEIMEDEVGEAMSSKMTRKNMTVSETRVIDNKTTRRSSPRVIQKKTTPTLRPKKREVAKTTKTGMKPPRTPLKQKQQLKLKLTQGAVTVSGNNNDGSSRFVGTDRVKSGVLKRKVEHRSSMLSTHGTSGGRTTKSNARRLERDRAGNKRGEVSGWKDELKEEREGGGDSKEESEQEVVDMVDDVVNSGDINVAEEEEDDDDDDDEEEEKHGKKPRRLVIKLDPVAFIRKAEEGEEDGEEEDEDGIEVPAPPPPTPSSGKRQNYSRATKPPRGTFSMKQLQAVSRSGLRKTTIPAPSGKRVTLSKPRRTTQAIKPQAKSKNAHRRGRGNGARTNVGVRGGEKGGAKAGRRRMLESSKATVERVVVREEEQEEEEEVCLDLEELTYYPPQWENGKDEEHDEGEDDDEDDDEEDEEEDEGKGKEEEDDKHEVGIHFDNEEDKEVNEDEDMDEEDQHFTSLILLGKDMHQSARTVSARGDDVNFVHLDEQPFEQTKTGTGPRSSESRMRKRAWKMNCSERDSDGDDGDNDDDDDDDNEGEDDEDTKGDVNDPEFVPSRKLRYAVRRLRDEQAQEQLEQGTRKKRRIRRNSRDGSGSGLRKGSRTEENQD